MSKKTIPFDEYRRKVLGCWLGKAVGGTLGGPVEGHLGPLSLSFYDPIPEEMLPNDDLDLQVVWLEAIMRKGLPIDRRMLADAWLESVHFYPDEYGVAARNLKQKLMPPLSGAFDNTFTAGMGAAIRTEIWACIAPGDPDLAASLAVEDACVDHAGEGIYAAQYLAALESMAFISSDRATLLSTAIKYIPETSRVSNAIRDTQTLWEKHHNLLKCREILLERYGTQNFTDVAINLAFTILGWLSGDNFDSMLCNAVNCGMDTDCTGATLGSILGIIDPRSIGEKWLKPIGKSLILSPSIVGMHHTSNLENFTDQISQLAVKTLEYYKSESLISAYPDNLADPFISPRTQNTYTKEFVANMSENEALIATEPLLLKILYPKDISLKPNEETSFQLKVTNTDIKKSSIDVRINLGVPHNWTIDNSKISLTLKENIEETIYFKVTAFNKTSFRTYLNLLDIRLEVDAVKTLLSAGLPMTIPWKTLAQEEFIENYSELPSIETMQEIEVAGHSINISPKSHIFVSEFKTPNNRDYRFVTQANRSINLWIDGKHIHSDDSKFQVSAFHRPGPTSKDVFLTPNWHRIIIAVSPGEDGKLFCGIGNPATNAWIYDLEWRMP